MQQGTIRDRIVEFRRVRAGELIPHERNWRQHPAEQGRRAGGSSGRDRLCRRAAGAPP
jgi:hypothetical protein